MGKAQHTLGMEQTLEHYDFGLKDGKIPKKKSDNVIKSNKCNQCDYASSGTGGLKRHLKCTVEKRQTNATSVTLQPLMHTF